MSLILFIIALVSLIKRRESLTLTCCTLLFTDLLGIGGETDFLIPSLKYSDIGIILLLIIAATKIYLNQFCQTNLNFFFIFMVYLLTIISFDYFINQTSPISIIKSYRHWILLLPIFFYRSFSLAAIKQLLRNLLNLTILFSAILLLEYYLGFQITQAGRVDFTTSDGDYSERGAFGTTYTLLFILLLMTGYFKLPKKLTLTYIAILCMIYINSITRSTIIVTASAMFFLYWWIHNKSTKFLLKGTLLLALATLVIFSIPKVKDRFFPKEKIGMTMGDYENIGTLEFRLLLTGERLNYILKDPIHAMIGIGGVHESAFKSKQVFKIGLPDDDGNITQLDTGDISWAVLFLRLGLIGTALYIIAWIVFIRKLNKFKSRESKALVVYLTTSVFFLSFVSGNIANASFIFIPLLFLSKLIKEKNILRLHYLQNKIKQTNNPPYDPN